MYSPAPVNENPDIIRFGGEKYGVNVEEVLCTLTSVHNLKTNKPSVIVSMRGNTPIGSSWLHKSDDKEVADTLNRYMWSSVPWHSDVMETLKKNGIVKGEDRYATLLAGRVWEINTGPRQFSVIAAFWQGHQDVKGKLNHVKYMFYLMGKDITKALFEFPNYKDRFLTYNEAFASMKPVQALSKTVEKALMKIQHLSPDAKKALIDMPINKLEKAADKLGITTIELKQALGMDIAENVVLVSESPDSITIDDPYNPMDSSKRIRLEYDGPAAIGVFMIWDFGTWKPGASTYRDPEKTFTSWIVGDRRDYTLFFGGKHIGAIDANAQMHDDVWDDFRRVIHRVTQSGGDTVQRWKRWCNGRVYEDDAGQLYLSCWENGEIVRHSKKYIEAIVKHFGGKPKEALYQFKPMDDDEFVTYESAFGISKPAEIEPVGSKEKEKAWKAAEQLHLMPPEKKAALLKQLGAANSSNKLQTAADKLNITPIQLKQLLGKDIAETLDIDRNIKPQRTYQLHNLDLDTVPPIDLRAL
jgi:hypothetical protein